MPDRPAAVRFRNFGPAFGNQAYAPASRASLARADILAPLRDAMPAGTISRYRAAEVPAFPGAFRHRPLKNGRDSVWRATGRNRLAARRSARSRDSLLHRASADPEHGRSFRRVAEPAAFLR